MTHLLSTDTLKPGDKAVLLVDITLGVDDSEFHKYKTVVVTVGEHYTIVDVYEGKKDD